jgi:hypothetical protein
MCEINNVAAEKLLTFLQALEIEQIDDFLLRANVESYRGLGRAYAIAAKAACNERDIYKKAVQHYADESFWDDPHPDLGYGPNTMYAFEDEFDGQIAGFAVAQQALKDAGEVRGENK